jgi:hypothetical protein
MMEQLSHVAGWVVRRYCDDKSALDGSRHERGRSLWRVATPEGYAS